MSLYKELELLGNYSDGYEINTVGDILNENEIPYLKKQRGIGECLRIITGFNTYGIEVYVHKDDFIKAKELIKEIFEQEE